MTMALAYPLLKSVDPSDWKHRCQNRMAHKSERAALLSRTSLCCLLIRTVNMHNVSFLHSDTLARLRGANQVRADIPQRSQGYSRLHLTRRKLHLSVYDCTLAPASLLIAGFSTQLVAGSPGRFLAGPGAARGRGFRHTQLAIAVSLLSLSLSCSAVPETLVAATFLRTRSVELGSSSRVVLSEVTACQGYSRSEQRIRRS